MLAMRRQGPHRVLEGLIAVGNLNSQQFPAKKSPARGRVQCDYCGKEHSAEYSHQSQYGDQSTYAVVCDKTPDTVDYYTSERVSPGKPRKGRRVAGSKDLGLDLGPRP